MFSATSDWRRITCVPSQPTARPIATPPVALTTQLIIASPSTSSRTRAGAPMRENVATAATGSVGPTTAPSTNAASQLIPGTIAWATTATAPIVASTSPIESSPSGRSAAPSSRGDDCHAAACSSGGRNTRKTTSGSRSSSGSSGTNPIASPPTTSTIGYGTEIDSASRTRIAAAPSSMITNSMSPKATATLGSSAFVAEPLQPPLGASDHVDGPTDAPLELVMYGDFQCPFCTAAQPILRRVRERLDGRLRFAFRHFPLTEVHPDAERAAEASEAAAAQGAFWPMHDALYGARGELGLESVIALAAGLGLDAERVRAELAAGTHADRVAADVRSGKPAGVSGTPTFFVNGARHRGGYDAQTLIAALEG